MIHPVLAKFFNSCWLANIDCSSTPCPLAIGKDELPEHASRFMAWDCGIASVHVVQAPPVAAVRDIS